MKPWIVLEGGDAVGKQTQARNLVSWFNHLYLKPSWHKAVYTSFPNYENYTGMPIKQHLGSSWSAKFTVGEFPSEAEAKHVNELVFQCLQTVNRLEELPKILDLLRDGPVVSDRYWPSGYVYGKVNGLSPSWLLQIHALFPPPDMFILLDADHNVREIRRPVARDRYEEQTDMLKQVHQEYRNLWASNHPSFSHYPQDTKNQHVRGMSSWKIVDANRSPSDVQLEIQTLVEEHLRVKYQTLEPTTRS